MLPSESVSPSVGKNVGGLADAPEFPLLLIVTVLPELLITLFEVEVFTLLELLLLLIVTVLPELLIELFEVEVFTVLELLVLLITTELPVLVITLFEVAVLTLLPPLDVDVAEVLLTID